MHAPDPRTRETARDRLIVALDMSGAGENEALVRRLGPAVSFYKVGWGPLLSGTSLLPFLLGEGKQLFLDLKFFDVPNTVQTSVGFVAKLGARFVTVHGNQSIIEAALRGRGDSGLEVLAVTALTSFIEEDVRRLYHLPPNVTLEQHVVNVARRLVELGCRGVIASPQEVAAIRRAVPRDVIITTPGIRDAGAPAHDQQRTGTAYDSIRAGADYLVVGRPIYTSDDPAATVEGLVEQIERGLEDRER
jgi:orotidine-5'-phosphate decarboxylase